MLEPIYVVEQSGHQHLEICEHNWHALPGPWAIESLPEGARPRKEWLYWSAWLRWQLEDVNCPCAKRLLVELVRKDLEGLPDWDPARPLGQSCVSLPHTACAPFELLRQWHRYHRGMLYAKEVLNRFGDMGIDWATMILTEQDHAWQTPPPPRPTERGRAAFKIKKANLDEHFRHVIIDMLGNPFRPVELVAAWTESRDGIVRKIAAAIYENFAFADMPILADALEEAGCCNAEVLAHCRAPTMHVRGCWVLDLLLGK